MDSPIILSEYQLQIWLSTSVILSAICYVLTKSNKQYQNVPLVNAVRGFSPFAKTSARYVFAKTSQQIMNLAKRLYPNQPYRVLTDWGEVLVLPSEFAHEIRNESSLSFGRAIQQDNHANIPGFEPVRLIGREDQLIQVVARKQLTKHLSRVIEPLSKESAFALPLAFGESTEWHNIRLKPAVLDIIARLSSRIYLGNQLCRNEEWLSITKNYTTAFFHASASLRYWPRALRPLAHWFSSDCQTLRSERQKARRVINALQQRRANLVRKAVEAGKQPPVFHDSLTWAEEEAHARRTTFNPAIFQLTLSLLAIHTTYDLLEQCMLDLAQHPNYIPALRQEVVDVLREQGWQKTSLYNMKLLDSAIKESQRLKPGSIASMRRYATADVHLSNGLVVKRGSRLNVDSSRMLDPALHSDPGTYDPYRFLRMRAEPGKQHMAQLAATSVDHLGFGHGEHACPGRFFAANEIKVALCHVLVKYDWIVAPESSGKVEPDVKGMLTKASPMARILIRKREDIELDLDAL